MGLQTEVYQHGPSRFDMAGQRLPTHMRLTDEAISPGLAKRLLRYGQSCLDDDGLLAAVEGWEVTVGTDDAHDEPADRSYWVTWKNTKGTTLTITGILTAKGWPVLNHGMQIERS